MGGFRAVIFDMDGVLADSEPLYHQGLNEVLRDFGLAITEAEHATLLGKTIKATWDVIFEKHSLPASYDECVVRYDRVMVRLLSQPREPLPGAQELLTEIRRRRTPLGLASSSLSNWIDALLHATGLDGSFDVIVSSTDVENGKPAPDIFLHTAAKLGVPPGQCLVVEDSRSGVAAAKAAGMYAVQLRAASTALPPLPEADLVLERLSDFPLALLEPVNG